MCTDVVGNRKREINILICKITIRILLKFDNELFLKITEKQPFNSTIKLFLAFHMKQQFKSPLNDHLEIVVNASMDMFVMPANINRV